MLQRDDISFFLTNRIPRRLLTLFMGWFSQVENPLVARASLYVWQLFADLKLEEARKTSFRSVHDCFTRELKEGLRPVDPDPAIMASPCDGNVTATGKIRGTELIQAKGHTYTLDELLNDPDLVARYRDGSYVTLRLTPSMYHRFHAPYDCRVSEINYITGDVWNVNPIALQRIKRLYCKNERVVVPLQIDGLGQAVTLVPVAAILVASLHLNFVDVLLNLKYEGPNRIACDASFRKGQEMGYFHHGSTIIVLATGDLQPCRNIVAGAAVRMGQQLLERNSVTAQRRVSRNGIGTE